MVLRRSFISPSYWSNYHFVPEEQDSMYIWKGISRIAKWSACLLHQNSNPLQHTAGHILHRSVPLLLEPAVNAGAVSSLYQTEHWWQRLNSWLSLWIGSSMLNHLQMLALLWITGNVICTVLPYQLFITSIFLEELSCGPGFGSTFILFFFPLPCFSSFSL